MVYYNHNDFLYILHPTCFAIWIIVRKRRSVFTTKQGHENFHHFKKNTYNNEHQRIEHRTTTNMNTVGASFSCFPETGVSMRSPAPSALTA